MSSPGWHHFFQGFTYKHLSSITGWPTNQYPQSHEQLHQVFFSPMLFLILLLKFNKLRITQDTMMLSNGYLSGRLLSDFTFTFHFHALEKEMATHSSVLAWRIPGTEEPGGLPSVGPYRVGHDWGNLAVAAADCFKTTRWGILANVNQHICGMYLHFLTLPYLIKLVINFLP